MRRYVSSTETRRNEKAPRKFNSYSFVGRRRTATRNVREKNVEERSPASIEERSRANTLGTLLYVGQYNGPVLL